MNTSTSSLNIVFAGSPDFAAVALKKLLHTQHHLVAVYTQPDRPAGRGLKLKPSPVKVVAQEHGITVEQPTTLKDGYTIAKLCAYQADVIVVAAYGLLLPADVLHCTKYGCLNIHPSLLPRWRGAAPIQRTIYAGDSISGVTIMQMDQGLDTGPILLKREYVLDPKETAATLTAKLADLGADALITTLGLLVQNKIQPENQDNALATYAQKITKEEALIDWQDSPIQIEREVRAFNPWPVAYTIWHDQHLRVWQARVLAETQSSSPRTLLAASKNGIDIATGEGGVLRITTLQLPGGKILSAADFYNARRSELEIGEHFI